MRIHSILAGAAVSLFSGAAGSNCRPGRSSSSISSSSASSVSSVSSVSSSSSIASSSSVSSSVSSSASSVSSSSVSVPSSSASSSSASSSASSSVPSSSASSSSASSSSVSSSTSSSASSSSSAPLSASTSSALGSSARSSASSSSASASVSPTPICFNIIAHSTGNDHVDGQTMVVQDGLPYPFFGLSGSVWVEVILSLTPEGYIEQQGSVEQGGVIGYAGYPYLLLAPLNYYTANTANGYAPAVCSLNKATAAVDCLVAGYGPQLYSAIPHDYSVDYELFWTDTSDGINNTPVGADQYLPASMSYVEVDCPLSQAP